MPVGRLFHELVLWSCSTSCDPSPKCLWRARFPFFCALFWLPRGPWLCILSGSLGLVSRACCLCSSVSGLTLPPTELLLSLFVRVLSLSLPLPFLLSGHSRWLPGQSRRGSGSVRRVGVQSRTSRHWLGLCCWLRSHFSRDLSDCAGWFWRGLSTAAVGF